jgi:hypothetical protein
VTNDPHVIAELRALFKSGATPSRLVRHILARHGLAHGRQTDSIVRFYFVEAFGFLLRPSASLLNQSADEMPFAGHNGHVLHQIVERRAIWDDDPAHDAEWLGPLTATDTGTLRQQASAVTTTSAKESPELLRSSARYLSEQVAILSRLVECLQQQVIDLEARVASDAEPTLAPVGAAS